MACGYCDPRSFGLSAENTVLDQAEADEGYMEMKLVRDYQNGACWFEANLNGLRVQTPVLKYCPWCGKRLREGLFCPTCERPFV